MHEIFNHQYVEFIQTQHRYAKIVSKFEYIMLKAFHQSAGK